MQETFSKFRLYNEIDGRLIYSLMINNNVSADYFEDKKHEKKQQMSNDKNIPYHNLHWEDVQS